MLAAGSILWCCVLAIPPIRERSTSEHRSMGECASTPSHILLTPYRLTPHCAVTPTQTRHKHAYSPHVVQPSVPVMSWIAMKNKTMHRPLLKIPVKYMDTEKAQAEHSAENTTLAVTVISWKVLRRLSCKSICAIYMGEELCWPQLFFLPNGAVAPIKALRVYLNVREKVWSWGQHNLRQNDGTCASGGRGGECPCECLPYMTYRTWTAKHAF